MKREEFIALLRREADGETAAFLDGWSDVMVEGWLLSEELVPSEEEPERLAAEALARLEDTLVPLYRGESGEVRREVDRVLAGKVERDDVE